MMKRITTLILISLIAFALFADTVVLEPFYGISGLPVGSNYYKGGGTGESAGKWIDATSKYNNVEGSDFTVKSSYSGTNYTDVEMIGLLSLQDLSYDSTSESSFESDVKISVSAPNGLYMTSQSQPSYKRPIELWFYPAARKGGSNLDNSKVYQYITQLSDATPSVTLNLSSVGSIDVFWFDIVLVMPGKLNPETNEIEVEDKTTKKTTYYSLVDADDYSCLVTISVTYNGSTTTCTIPFTGYYDSSLNEQSWKQDGVSMNIEMNSKAYNLDLKSDQGNWIDIGGISFNGTRANSTAGVQVTKNTTAVIFFSSSNDPYTAGSKFQMVKDDLAATTARTSENSLGFKLRVTAPTTTTSTNSDYANYGASYSSTYLEFDGTAYIEKDVSSYTASVYSSKGFIVPDGASAYFKVQNTKTWYEYSSRIQIQLENSSVTMLNGRYTGDIYVHVMLLQ